MEKYECNYWADRNAHQVVAIDVYEAATVFASAIEEDMAWTGDPGPIQFAVRMAENSVGWLSFIADRQRKAVYAVHG